MSSTGPYRPDEGGRGHVRRRRRPEHGSFLSNPMALEREEDRARLIGRVRVIEGLVVALVIVLVLGFWNLQMVQGTRYARMASENQFRNTRIRPARGLVLDRHGRVLATNTASYEIALIREQLVDEPAALAWLATITEAPVETLQARVAAQRNLPRFRPVVVASGLDQSQVVRVEARRREYPGVIVQISPQRFYPLGATAAHVLGHVGEISTRQLESWDDRYRMGDVVGQLGIEGTYNDELQGIAGSKLAVVNNVGREIRLLEQVPPEPGHTVILTLDADLQLRAEELLGTRRGAIVALDVNSGGILALASSPAFDPNSFAERFSAEEWQALIQDPSRPLQNRALGAHLPPGSPFKLVMAVAGLEEGIITGDTTFFCPGGKNMYGRFFRCLGEHGEVNVVEALAYSCNSFFYELGVKLGRERIVRWASRLGLGSATGIDLPDEQDGIIPSDEWLASMGYRFYPGETVSISIGQGRLATSPLQLAHMAATLAGGFVRPPHLLFRVEEAADGGHGARTHTPQSRPSEFSESTRRTVLRGMRGSVQYGTSARARLAPIAVGGKTGTAQVASAENVAEEDEDRPEHLRNHAWFVGVAPVDNPEIAISVYLEHGGSGGRDAAPVGRQVLAHYFGLEPGQVPVEEMPITPADAEAPAVREDGADPGRQR